jgi:hypothetical protein
VIGAEPQRKEKKGGEGCESCVDCTCEDDDTKCPGRCHDCSGGSCIDDDTKCTGCCKCSGGNCVDENENCASVQRCENCVCKCDNNCYEWEDVFPSSPPSPCPECDNSQGGCYSSAYWIQVGYAYFTGGIPPQGDMGVCGNPTKKAIVGYHIFCTDYDTDVDRIVEIVLKLGLDLTTYVDCGKCVLTRSPSACLKCIAGLIVGDIVDESPCIFVDGCEHCYAWDENCSFPIEIDVVDWEKVDAFCHPGLDWP